MNIIADLHTHTIASTHAYSTINEMTTQAAALGYRALAMTDHGLGMPDSPHKWYFSNLKSLPDVINGNFLLLKGVEANATSIDGSIDMDDSTLKKLDWVIVSLHSSCIDYMDEHDATQLWLNIAENPLVDMIGHSEQRQYKYNYDLVTQKFAKFNKVVELNANSKISRPGGEENMRQLALACKKNGTKVAINSDAHSVYTLGNTEHIVAMLKEMDFPEELVINTDLNRLINHLTLRNKDVVRRIEGLFPLNAE